MRKLSLYIFLGLMFCNIGFAEKYACSYSHDGEPFSLVQTIYYLGFLNSLRTWLIFLSLKKSKDILLLNVSILMPKTTPISGLLLPMNVRLNLLADYYLYGTS